MEQSKNIFHNSSKFDKCKISKLISEAIHIKQKADPVKESAFPIFVLLTELAHEPNTTDADEVRNQDSSARISQSSYALASWCFRASASP